MATKRRRLFGREKEQWLVYHVGVPSAYYLLKGLAKTWKMKRINGERAKLRPAIFAIYHGDLTVGAQELPHIMPNVEVLTSRSRDGWTVTRYVHMFKARTIRGGSSKGAESALRQMRKTLLKGRAVIIPVDGPRGPEGKAKIGVIAIASQTGAAIIPGAVKTNSCWRAKSWDRMMICKPGAEVSFEYGEPMYVPPDLDREGLEEYRQRLDEVLAAMHVGTV